MSYVSGAAPGMAAARNGSCRFVDRRGIWDLECRSEIAHSDMKSCGSNQHTSDGTSVIEGRRTGNCQHRVRKIGKYEQGDGPRRKQYGPLPERIHYQENQNDMDQAYRLGYQCIPSQMMNSSGSSAQRR